MVTFYKTDSISQPAEFLADKINRSLKTGKKVLWLVPGGSAIAVAVASSKLLDKARLSNLTVTLTDERYGRVGHPDSNALQLHSSGLELGNAKFLPVLTAKDIKATAKEFNDQMAEAFELNDFKIGLFGMGADGHIAGIKPGCPTVASPRLAEYFSGDDFERITLTPVAIAKLDAAAVYAVGLEKHSQLDRLQTKLTVTDQPAQILKSIAGLTIFSDYEGDN